MAWYDYYPYYSGYYPYSSYLYPYSSYYYPYSSLYPYSYYSSYLYPYSSYAVESALRRSRVEADLAVSRAASEVALRDSIRRLRIDNEIESILGRY
jgi:hypothetical protein